MLEQTTREQEGKHLTACESESAKQTTVRQQQEIKQLKAILSSWQITPPSYQDCQHEIDQLKAILQVITSEQNTTYRVYGPKQDVHTARLIALDDIIDDPRRLHAVTLCTVEQFDYILHRYTAYVKKHGDTTLFWDDDGRASDPGNRSKIYMRHALLLSLMHKKGGHTQSELGAIFGIDQSNINRSLSISNKILAEVLPTARKMTEKIKEAETLEDVEKIISPDPDTGKITVVVDGTHVPIDRSKDKDQRKADYSGKKKAFTLNTNVMTDTRKRMMWIGKTAPGSTHDLTLLKEDPPDLGILTQTMSSADTLENDKPVVYFDKGYQGISKLYPGADTKQPIKRRRNSDKKTGGLTPEELAYNKEISSVRIVVEHSIGMLKRYRIITRPYCGTAEELNDEINIISGLVNLAIDWDRIKSENKLLMQELARRRASR